MVHKGGQIHRVEEGSPAEHLHQHAQLSDVAFSSQHASFEIPGTLTWDLWWDTQPRKVHLHTLPATHCALDAAACHRDTEHFG